MKKTLQFKSIYVVLIVFVMFSACGKPGENSATDTQNASLAKQNALPNRKFNSEEKPESRTINLQSEVLSNQNTLTTSPIGKVDFKNFTYLLPQGWQDIDSKDVTLEDGVRPMSKDKIGMSYVNTKFGDATGDGEDEAFVILKIETAGAAIPQVVYVFTLKDAEPDLIWHFRTGDRADGGLKSVYTEDGEMIVELFGEDRYVLGEVETMQIEGDEAQICCPAYFTRSHYKWNGADFRMQGKRETFSMIDQNAPPIENKRNDPEDKK